MKLNLPTALALACAIAAASCSSKDIVPVRSESAATTSATVTLALGDEAQAEHYSVVLTLSPKEVKVGDTKLTAVVKHHGQPEPNATVKVDLSMPGHAMDATTVDLKHSKDGVYLGPANLSMGGEWQAKVSVSNPEGHSNVFVYKFVALQE